MRNLTGLNYVWEKIPVFLKIRRNKIMKEPVLVVMAAGMGSRYGGLKQIDPVDQEGHIIMDFSIYDAVRAGFKKVIFIIKNENDRISAMPSATA